MKFTETHEWIKEENGIGTIGVTDYAQKELGDIVYVELPEVGKMVKAGDESVVLESTKAAADIYSPVSGEIKDVNSALNETPELINESPEEGGWLFRVDLSDSGELDKLMDKDQYTSTIQ